MRSFLERHDIASGRVTTVLVQEGRVEAPSPSPCGSWVLVNSAGALWRVDLAQPGLRSVDTGGLTRCNNDHGFSPDGRWIAFCAHHHGQGSEIFLMPAEGGGGGEVRRISPQPRSWFHGFSPDGAAIVYPAARGPGRGVDIHLMPLGGQEQRLTGGEGHADGPDFSADGRQIFFNTDRDGHAQIWVMNRDGSGQRPLFRDACVNWFAHPSPDGRWLVYLAYPPGTAGHPPDLPVSIVLCRPDGSDRQVVARILGGQGSINVPNWAPDSGSFYYMRYTP